MSTLDAAYYGREQTAVKHEMLRKYIGPAARIIGSFANCFEYIDCCSGPWNTVSADFKDSSFSIACEQLRAARAFLKSKGREVEFRCLFIEEKPEPFRQLQEFCRSVTDIDIRPLEGDFTQLVPDILRSIKERPKSFPFFFIDPTGWSPLAIPAIAPLLRSQPSEVLINFMTSHIHRFLESSDFETTLGPDYMKKIVGLTGQDRGDAAAYSFADEIRRFYPYTCTSVVLNPIRNQTHFHLIYGTRHPRGLQKFKEAEKSCFSFMQAVRIDARQRQNNLFAEQQLTLIDVSPVLDSHLQNLRREYLREAFKSLEGRMAQSEVDEEHAWKIVSRFPLVWQSDLRGWWREHGPTAGTQRQSRALRA